MERGCARRGGIRSQRRNVKKTVFRVFLVFIQLLVYNFERDLSYMTSKRPPNGINKALAKIRVRVEPPIIWDLARSNGASAKTAKAAERVAQDIWDFIEFLSLMEKYKPKKTVAKK